MRLFKLLFFTFSVGLMSMTMGCAGSGGYANSSSSENGNSPELAFFKKAIKAAAKAKCGSRCSERGPKDNESDELQVEVDELSRKIRSMENEFSQRCVRAGYVGYSSVLKRCM